MKIVVTTRNARELNTDLLVIAIAEQGARKMLASHVARFRLRGDHARRDFSGKKDESIVHYGGKSGPKRVAFIGLGREPIDADRVRNAAATAATLTSKLELGSVAWLIQNEDAAAEARAVAEGFALGAYRFDRYKTGKKKRLVRQLSFTASKETQDDIRAAGIEGLTIAEAACFARDLTNRSPGEKTATDLANLAAESGARYGHQVTIWDKKQITKAGMGGLLAVNRGSEEPPTFTILEWHPADARNSKPIVLVGKGVVFDTGGLSLKPTLDAMDKMKYDMAGAAAVIGALEAVARLELPLHVVGLVPATDNRPGRNAYLPSEVVHMHSGATVEVTNTDAEGRMILADALSYARSLDPEVVVDIATLTGAQVVALGTFAAAILANEAAEENGYLAEMIEAGRQSGERVAPLPLWDEYASLLRSDVADIKNLGNRHAGTITAAKFLQHFVDYPWLHLDIAGPAFIDSPRGYIAKGGTGFGVRLFVDFLQRRTRDYEQPDESDE